MKTSDLIGEALNRAVAKCEGVEYIPDYVCDALGYWHEPTCYAAFWAQGGPIIEREWQAISAVALRWCLNNVADPAASTLLTFWMRCYVASKLGDEVEMPEELK